MNARNTSKKKKGLGLDLWKRLLPFAKVYWKEFAVLVVIMLMVAAVDLLGPIMTRRAIDDFIVPGTTEGLSSYVLEYALLVIWQTVNVFGLIAMAGKIEMKLVYDIRKAAFDHLQNLSLDYYDRTPVGWIMARLTSDAGNLGDTISWGIVDLVWSFAVMIGVSLIMVFINPILALVALAVVPLLFWASRYFQKRILRTQRLVRKTNSRITGVYNEAIMGARTNKTLVREDESLADFQVLSQRMNKRSVQSALFNTLYLPVVLSLGAIGTAAVLTYGGIQTEIGAISFGTLAAFLTYTRRLFDPMQELARVMAEMQSAQASGERILKLLDEKVSIVDSPEVQNRFGTVLEPKLEARVPLSGAIEMRNLDFWYKKEEPIFRQLNISIEPGTSVALVGETGSGKSTFVNVACRFYEPKGGEVLIDGQPYQNLGLAGLHSQLGYVLQTPQLFSGTVAENIRYGRPEAGDSEVYTAAETVHALEFIEKLEKGFDTEVGENGALLSLGERQLISFARAVLADPRILVLDEATSSIDSHTEALIQQAIKKVLAKRTSLIIAHRLSTIVDVDRILVFSHGNIVEDGSHQELMAKKGMYYELFSRQFSDLASA